MEPQTRYIDRPEGRLAYQVLEGGSAGHIVCLYELTQHLDLVWTDPVIAEVVMEVARDGLTQIAFQQRGLGLSDPVSRPPTVEEQAADVLAVMDAEGVRVATLCGIYSTCLPAALVAAQHPDRVSGLVLTSPILAGPRSARPGDGFSAEQIDEYVASYERVKADWGSGSWLALWDATMDSPLNTRLAGMVERCAASPEMARAVVDHWLDMDGREILPQVRVPTRVLASPHHAVLPEAAIRAAAEAIPGAEYHVLPPTVRGDSMGTSWKPTIRHCVEMAVGNRAKYGTPDRVLASILFTDVVGSTEHVAAIGDQAWAAVLGEFEQLVRRELTEVDGRFVIATGDGALCELPGPAAAVRCARAICDAAPALGIQVRAGIHTGECERRGKNLAGLAVHIGARVCAVAGPGEVLVSHTVQDLVAGSELSFASRGEHELKGVPGRWELFAAGQEAAPTEPLDAAAPTPADRIIMSLARRTPGVLRSANRMTNSVQRRRFARRA